MRAPPSASRCCRATRRSKSRRCSRSPDSSRSSETPAMRAPEWLIAQPVAHRGLHDISRGIVENTLSSCAAAARSGFGIEVDLQLTADGEAMVHHDYELGRLT